MTDTITSDRKNTRVIEITVEITEKKTVEKTVEKTIKKTVDLMNADKSSFASSD